MYGLIGKIRTLPGRASELARLLTSGAASLPGNLSYVVARDPSDADVLWVTEVWVDEASHAASLRLASVEAAIRQGRSLIAGFEQHVETQPLEGSVAASSPEAALPGRVLSRLYHHGAWADARLLEATRRVPVTVPEALRELAHVRGSQATWLARIRGRPSPLAVWPELDLADLERVGPELDGSLIDLVDSLGVADLERVIAYENSAGEQESALTDILTHLAVHGQYHRGKANAALRAAGAEPVNVDVITWSRAGSPSHGS